MLRQSTKDQVSLKVQCRYQKSHQTLSRIDSNINYLTKINYRMRARFGRPKDEVDTSELVELAGVKNSNDYS
jgi:hypothetical protein